MNPVNKMFTCMLMPLLAFCGSTSFVIRKYNINFASKEQFLGDERVVFTDSIDCSKWIFCTTCKKCYLLSCVTSYTEQQVESKGGLFLP